MGKDPRILFLGNIRGDGSKSMHLVLKELMPKFTSAKAIEPTLRTGVLFYKLFIYPLRLLPKRNYQIYHIIDHSYGHLAHFLPSKRTVVTCHDLIPLIFPQNLSWWGRASYHFYISGLKRAKRIIAVSNSTKGDLIKLLKISPTRIRVIPNEIDFKPFKKLKNKQNLKKKYSLEGKTVLLTMGSGFYKNFSISLRAFKELKNKYPDLVLLKIGKLRREDSEFIERFDLKNSVLEKKNLSSKELAEIYNISDILVFPSLYEGFGRPPLEAMACGLPVITSSSSSLPEVVGDAAVKINPLSQKELKNEIIKLIENPSHKNKLIKKGLARAKKFKKRNIKIDLESVYKEVLSS